MSEFLCKNCLQPMGVEPKKGEWKLTHYEPTDCVPQLDDDDVEAIGEKP